MEGLIAPGNFVADETKTYFHVHYATIRNVEAVYPEADANERVALADEIAKHVYDEVERRREIKRVLADKEAKRELLARNKHGRCYLCGFLFSEEAKLNLTRDRGRDPVPLPKLVDVLRPRGLNGRDVDIEVEHIVPVALGGKGAENLALSCGWCNKHKSSRISIYDAPLNASRSTFFIGKRKLHELPEPFWMVRTLGMHRRCQHRDGCSATVETHEIFLSLRDWDGSPNPTNFKFYCSEHDPIAKDRFVTPATATNVWKERKRHR